MTRITAVITRMDLLGGYNNPGQSWDYINYYASENYKERVKYDANGNILKYLRNGSTIGGKPLSMDSLEYRYYAGTDQLRQVHDNVSATNYSEDIDNQTDTSNYVYDPIGNLVRDKAEGIDSIKWNVYGKITNIYKNSGTKISYSYDASGNRISKIVASNTDTITTWYVRDATGNVMSAYSLKQDTVKQDELHMYGSSRLGILRPERFLTLSGQYGDTSGTISLLGTWRGKVFTRGKKFFELTNHLGNVLVTITDRKQQIAKNDSVISYCEADVATANDYYPFGMLMPGRKYSAGADYRYGFNGKENDNEVKGEGAQQDYGMRIYDPRVGRFLSVDPLTPKYPFLTPYQFASNSPIKCIDVDGLEGDPVRGFENWINGIIDDLTSKEKWVDGARSFNQHFNPVYQGVNHISKIATHRDLEGNEYNGTPLRAGTELAADVMGYITFGKLFKVAGEMGTTAIEAEMNNTVENVARPRNVENPGTKPELKATTNNEVASTANKQAASAAEKQAGKSPTIQQKNATSVASESLVRTRLMSRLQPDEILMEKPRFYIMKDGKETFTTPDFAIYNTKTNQFASIPDAKNGGAGLSTNQSILNNQGGEFRGSSRYPQAKPQKIGAGIVTEEKTSIPYN